MSADSPQHPGNSPRRPRIHGNFLGNGTSPGKSCRLLRTAAGHPGIPAVLQGSRPESRENSAIPGKTPRRPGIHRNLSRRQRVVHGFAATSREFTAPSTDSRQLLGKRNVSGKVALTSPDGGAPPGVPGGLRGQRLKLRGFTPTFRDDGPLSGDSGRLLGTTARFWEAAPTSPDDGLSSRDSRRVGRRA